MWIENYTACINNFNLKYIPNHLKPLQIDHKSADAIKTQNYKTVWE